jgi:hypothetical protein
MHRPLIFRKLLKLEFEDSLATAISRRHVGDVLIIRVDANASLGRDDSKRNNDTLSSIGPHGFMHINAAGRRLHSFLELHDLATLSSFFKKQYYGTWHYPRSKLQHQLDHVFVLKSDLRRFTNCESCAFRQLIDSDHRCVRCALRFLVHLQRKRDPRARLTRLDYSPLTDPQFAKLFAEKVTSSFDNQSPNDVSYTLLSNSLHNAATQILPIRERAPPLWFASS